MRTRKLKVRIPLDDDLVSLTKAEIPYVEHLNIFQPPSTDNLLLLAAFSLRFYYSLTDSEGSKF